MLHTYYFFQTVDKITFIRLPDLYGQTAIGRLPAHTYSLRKLQLPIK